MLAAERLPPPPRGVGVVSGAETAVGGVGAEALVGGATSIAAETTLLTATRAVADGGTGTGRGVTSRQAERAPSRQGRRAQRANLGTALHNPDQPG